MEKKLLSVAEAAVLLGGLSRTRMYKLIKMGPTRGGIASLKIGKNRRIAAWSIDEFIEREMVAQGQKPPAA